MFSIRIRHGVTPKLYNAGPKGGNEATAPADAKAAY